MKEKQIREELIRCREILADLFQSGLIVYSEVLMEQLKTEANTVLQYGMSWLSGQLKSLYKQMDMRRHDLQEADNEELVRLFCSIDRYIEIGIRETDLDEAGNCFYNKI